MANQKAVISDLYMPVIAAPPPQELEVRLRERRAYCSSKFHQLLRVAAFWNPVAMLYADPDCGSILPVDACDIIARAHSRIFAEWLCLPLAEQFAEFARYLATLTSEGRQTFLKLLNHPKALDSLIPPGASSDAQELFSCDLRALVGLVSSW
jgi:hypothetical protein